MPYRLSDDKLTVLNAETGEVVKKHKTREEALAHLKALETNVPDAHAERVAFEPFKALAPNQPIKILPVGTFYRGDRVLTVDDKRAQEAVANFAKGLPRYGVKVNVEHGAEPSQLGKVGLVKQVKHVPGDGVYATEIEWTDAGKQLLAEDRYDAPSPEMVWTLNEGAMYQDPKTGEWYDNVLVGLAITTSPFFGGDVAVFSAKQPRTGGENGAEHMMDKPMESMMQKIMGMLQAMAQKMGLGEKPGEPPAADEMDKHSAAPLAELFAVAADAVNAKMPHHKADGTLDPAMLKKAMGGMGQPEDDDDEMKAMRQHLAKHAEEASADNNTAAPKEPAAENANARTGGTGRAKPNGGESMTDPITITPEQFADLQKKAGMVESMSAQLTTLQNANKELSDRFSAEQRLRRLGEFVGKAEAFSALSAKATDLGPQLLWLHDADATEKKDHYAYFESLLTATNGALAESGLFDAIGSGRTDDNAPAEPFLAAVEKIRVERFKDKSYEEGFAAAFDAAGAEHRDLADRYAARLHRPNQGR